MLRSIVLTVLCSSVTVLSIVNANSCYSIYSDRVGFPYESTSSVQGLGLAWLRDSNSEKTRRWQEEKNNKAITALTKNKDGSPNGLFTKISERTKERAPKNPPTPVETHHGGLLTKGGGLILKLKDGKELVIQAAIEHNPNEKSVVPEFKLSPDGDSVAYSLVRNGSDINLWYVYDLPSRSLKAGPFEVRLNDFNWGHDSATVFFTKWPSVIEASLGMNYAHNYVHNLKTGLKNLAFVPPAKDSGEFYSMDSFIGQDGATYLLASRIQGPADIPLAYHLGTLGKADVKKGEFQVGPYKWKTLQHSVRDNLGKVLGVRNFQIYLRTSENADKFKIEALDPMTGKKRLIVAEVPAATLLLSQLIGDRIFSQYLTKDDHVNYITIHDLDGNLMKTFKFKDVNMLGTGMLGPIVGSGLSETLYVTYQHILFPTETFAINPKTLGFSKLPSEPVNFDSQRVSTKNLHVRSADGTQIPLKIFARTDMKPKFVYLYYYGFIGFAQLPQWNKKFQAVLDLGGAVAIVNPRGGGEAGRDWQLSVKKDRFPSMDDVVAAADYVRAELPEAKIITSGRSLGGTLASALLAFHADKFDAFSIVVPIVDVNEWLNRSEFGRMAVDDFDAPRDDNGKIVDIAQHRHYLNRWNPLPNMDKLTIENFKPVLVSSGGFDDRVGPEQARFLVEYLEQKFPMHASKILLYEDKYSGHISRTEQDREAMFMALVAGITEADYRPLVLPK